jgi:hypothetical protein
VSVDPDAPTARESVEQRSIAAEHPSSAAAQPTFDGPTISAITPEEQARLDLDRMLSLDLPPRDFPFAQLDLPYRFLYGIKRTIYHPIKDWISPEPRLYIGNEGVVKEYTGPVDHTDALGALGQIAMMFLPGPKGVGVGEAAADELAVTGGLLGPGAEAEGSAAADLLANRQAWAELTTDAAEVSRRIYVPGESVAGATELNIIEHGASSDPLALARGEAGAESVVLSGVGKVGPNTLAHMLVEAGWQGGHVRLLSCGTGMANEAGITYGEQLSLALAEQGAPSVVAAPNGLLQIGSELFGTQAPLVVSPRVSIGIGAFGFW